MCIDSMAPSLSQATVSIVFFKYGCGAAARAHARGSPPRGPHLWQQSPASPAHCATPRSSCRSPSCCSARSPWAACAPKRRAAPPLPLSLPSALGPYPLPAPAPGLGRRAVRPLPSPFRARHELARPPRAPPLPGAQEDDSTKSTKTVTKSTKNPVGAKATVKPKATSSSRYRSEAASSAAPSPHLPGHLPRCAPGGGQGQDHAHGQRRAR